MHLFLVRLLQLVIGLLGISVVVLVHELGHFWAAKLLGVRVEVFGVGMGPVIFSHQGRSTEYRISLIPFGGYCQMDGSIDLVKALRDDVKNFNKGEEGSYFTTTPLVRLIIFACGPLVNFLFSILLFFIVAMIPTMQAVDDPRITLVSDYTALFGYDIPQPELLSGDYIAEVDGVPVSTWQEAEELIGSADKAELPLTIIRGGERMEATAYGTLIDGSYRYGISLWCEPVIGRVEGTELFQEGDRVTGVNGRAVSNSYDFYSEAGNDMLITLERNGQTVEVFYPASTAFPFAWTSRLIPLERDGIFASIGQAFSRAIRSIANTIDALLNLVNLNREDVRNEITGPTRAAQTIGNITTLGFASDPASGVRAFIYLVSLVSISLCVANIIPIPTFDGGQMVLNVWQMISGRELTPKSYVIFHIIGIAFTVVIVIALYSLDILHYLGV